MNFAEPFVAAIWAALFGSALALGYGAPLRVVPLVLTAAFTGRFGRELLMQLDFTMPVATVLAALAATALAAKIGRDPASVPVVAITAVLPLGPTPIIFNAIRAAFDVFSPDPAVAASAGAAFQLNSLKAFVIVAAMALGMTIPLLAATRERY